MQHLFYGHDYHRFQMFHGVRAHTSQFSLWSARQDGLGKSHGWDTTPPIFVPSPNAKVEYFGVQMVELGRPTPVGEVGFRLVLQSSSLSL